MSTHCKVRVEASQTKKGLKSSSIHLSPMLVAQLSPFISKSTPQIHRISELKKNKLNKIIKFAKDVKSSSLIFFGGPLLKPLPLNIDVSAAKEPSPCVGLR